MFVTFYALLTTSAAITSYPSAHEWHRVAAELVTIEPYERPTQEQVDASDTIGDQTLD